MRFRRWAQYGALLIFLLLLALAGRIVNDDLFLRMDPVLVGAAMIADRIVAWAFVPALIVLLSALCFGRIFCGYICPMGTTIDFSDRWFAAGNSSTLPSRISPHVKHYALAFTAGASLLGVSFVFWAAPLSLITRFYGLVIYPVISLITDKAVALFYPLASALDIRSLMFLEIQPPRYATQVFVLLFFVAVFAAVKISPRFWCRYLCPSGALLGLFSKKPLIRRRVNASCNECGVCARKCPMGAIDIDAPHATKHPECIACLECVRKCPQEAISFNFGAAFNNQHQKETYPGRREFLVAGMAGAGTAAMSLTGLNVILKDETAKGQVLPPRLIRPPGALPEPRFLAACVRCGQCMSACPTNTLQPIWLKAGWLALFSPAVTPRRTYCDPRCTACGSACPTGAIRQLDAGDRIWAKTGTAIIYRQKCLAWEHDKSCMVCDEVCPFDAIEFEKKAGLRYPVPHVIEDRCAGCGYCEHACPVYNDAAIVVTPMNALRLEEGESYEKTARSRGFTLQLKPEKAGAQFGYPEQGSLESTEPGADGLAPGFDQGR